MFARLPMIWNRLTTSLWALPILLVAAAALLAVLAVFVRLHPGAGPVWWLYSGDASAASGFLANLLTAMITMTTLAISITMVVLTLAAQSLGPRLIHIFMADTRTKLALGLFIGTVIYLLIVLRSVVGDTDTVPNLAVTLGAALVVISVIVLLFFVHHLARSIVSDTIIGRVGDILDAWIPNRFPEAENSRVDVSAIEIPPEPSGAPLRATTTGYIQALHHDDAVAVAGKAGVTVALHYRAGHFVLCGETIGWLWPPDLVDVSLQQTLLKTIVIGQTRTPVQDIEYPIRQLVEIALRALSPGVNDPYTAAAAVDRLAGSIGAIMARDEPQEVWRDADDVVRLIVPTTSLDGILDAAFNEIRQAGATHPAILIRLVDRLGQLLAQANDKQSKTILRHLHLVRATGERAIADEADRKDFLNRAEAAATALEQSHQPSAPV